MAYHVCRPIIFPEDKLFEVYSTEQLAPNLHVSIESLKEFPTLKEAQECALTCNESRDKFLNAHDYQFVLWSQSACNLSGIVFEFARLMTKICHEDAAFQRGTEWKNTHPICRMYVEQIAFLSKRSPDALKYMEDVRYCEARSA